MILKEDEYLIPEMILKTRCEHCEQCTMKTQCTKAKNGRGMEINLTYEAQKSKVRKLFDSDEGKQIMSNRSSQSEGAFGILKEDYKFNRLSRRGETGVKLEVYSAAIGFNIKKYHRDKEKLRIAE